MYRFPTYLAARHHEVRDHVRAWVATHPDPTPADFARGGLIAPGWPRPWGFDAGVGGQLVVRQELAAAGLSAPLSEIEVNWIGPTILGFGSARQRHRYLWPLLEGTEMWCRLHSEPDAGSDLAMIATRAERTSEGFRISGQKIWTYSAGRAHFGALLARTSGVRGDPDGISYFVMPMGSPGLTILPIKDLSGGSTVSEVFIDDVEIPGDHLIGELGAGLRIRRPNDPVPTVPFNPGFVPGHDPAVLRLLQLADWDDVPSTVGDRLLDLYIESQSIDALAILDSEEQCNAGSVAPQRADIRRLLTQEFRRTALEFVHDVRTEAESFDRRSVLDRLDGLGIAGTILRAAMATVPNGGSDIHLETVTARLFDGGSPVLTAWVGEQPTPERPTDQILAGEYEMLRTSTRRFSNDLPEVEPDRSLSAEALTPLALGELLSDPAAQESDVDWLAWLVTFEELGATPIGAELLSSVGFGAVVLHLLGGGSPRAAELVYGALSGETKLALAIQEPGPGWAYGDYTTAVVGGSQSRLRGSKLKVAHASAADVLIVVASREGSTHVYAVQPGAAGVTIVDEPAIEPSLAVSAVHLDQAPAVELCDGGLSDTSVARALAFGKIALAALCVGSARHTLDLAVDYVQQRRQFGKTLREFQAVSHRCGRSRVRLEQMRGLAYRAALEGAHADWGALHHSAAIARTFCADGYASITAEAMRAEGAIGITWENALGGHYRRAHWLRELLGGRAIERRLILDEALRLAAE